jgi:hypothetical protein
MYSGDPLWSSSGTPEGRKIFLRSLDRLGINRTEFGRWVKVGKAQPCGKHMNALLGGKADIERLVNRTGRG